MTRGVKLFTAVVAAAFAGIAIDCCVDIQTENAVFDTYREANEADGRNRRSRATAAEIAQAEKRAGLLVLLTLPICGGLLVSRKLKRRGQ
jgi:hypothetical protein